MKSCYINWSTGVGHSSFHYWAYYPGWLFLRKKAQVWRSHWGTSSIPLDTKGVLQAFVLSGTKVACLSVLVDADSLPQQRWQKLQGNVLQHFDSIGVEVKILLLLGSSPWLLWDLSDRTCTDCMWLCSNTKSTAASLCFLSLMGLGSTVLPPHMMIVLSLKYPCLW